MARDSKTGCLHGMTPIPPGKTVSDLLPVYSKADNEVHLGAPNPECASCRKPFNALRKRRKAVRMYPVRSMVPVVLLSISVGAAWRCTRQAASAMECLHLSKRIATGRRLHNDRLLS